MNPILSECKDLILEGISVRLNTYEKGENIQAFKICTTPRNYIKETQHFKEKEDNLNHQIANKEKHVEEINNKSININYPFVSYDDIVNINNNINQNNQKFHNNRQALSQSNPRPPQDLKKSLGSYPQNINYFSVSNKTLNSVEFNYDYDFDDNGVFYYLVKRKN